MKLARMQKNYFGMTYIATGETTGGLFFMAETVIPAGDGGPPLHVHTNEDENFYLKKGKLAFIVNGKPVDLNEGEFLHIEKGEIHTWKNMYNMDAELVIVFAPAGIEKMFAELDCDMANLKVIGLKYGTEFFV